MVIGTVNVQVRPSIDVFGIRQCVLRREDLAVAIGTDVEVVGSDGVGFDLLKDAPASEDVG